MKKKPVVILPLATALAAFGGVSAATANTGEPPQQPTSPHADAVDVATKGQPNVLFKAGDDLLGLIVTRNADGTVFAGHYSHSSHSSHSSHHSHYSSR